MLSRWVAEAALRHLKLVEDLNVLVQVCFLIIQLLHLLADVLLDFMAHFLLDFALNATSPVHARMVALEVLAGVSSRIAIDRGLVVLG